MTQSLGLSVGSANLVATTAGGPPTVRRAVLTLFPHRAPEVGVPADNPRLDERGLVLTGFVERVGDPVPMVAADGSTHRGERLLTEALQALIKTTTGGGPLPAVTAIAVPAHWPQRFVDALRATVKMQLVPDAVAALTALQAQPGLPTRGIVALCDFGATGTTITLADAANGLRPVGDTVRHEEFSGDLIDQAVLRHVLSDLDVDPSGTSAVAALGQVREQCRRAKERLSAETATGLSGPMPGAQSTVRLTRAELEELVRGPLEGVAAAVEDLLSRNGIARTDLVALATAGGGACIPFVTQRLSDAFRVPVTTTPEPQIIAARGAALIAGRGIDAYTRAAVAVPAGAALAGAVLAHAVTGDAAPNRLTSSAEVRPLAWSEDASTADDVLPPPGDHDGDPTDEARPAVTFDHGDGMGERAPLRWYRRPGVLFGAAAGVFLLAVAGLVLTWQTGLIGTVPAGISDTGTPQSVGAPVEAPPPPAPDAAPPPTQPVVQQPAPRRPTPAPRRPTPAPQRRAPAPQQPASSVAPPEAEWPEAEAPAPEPPAPEPPAPEPPPIVPDLGSLIPTIPGFDPGALIPGGTPADAGGAVEGEAAVEPAPAE